METTPISDCEKHPTQFLDEIKKVDDFSHILNSENTKSCATLIIGKAYSGKTHLIKNILNTYNNKNPIRKYIIITNNNDYNDIVENSESIINLNNNISSKKELNFYLNKIREINTQSNTVVVIDGLYLSNINNSKTINQFILDVILLKTELIISITYPGGLAPEIRAQFDNIIFFKDDCISNIKRTYEHYFGIIPSFKIYIELIKMLEDYECIMLYNRKHICVYKSNFNNFQKIKLINLNNDVNNATDCKLETKKLLQMIKENNLKIMEITKKNNELFSQLL